MRLQLPAASSVLLKARLAATDDLSNATKALFAGPGLVKLHPAAAHAAILGADLAPRIALPMP
jgi:hypothetical protein